MLKLCEEIIQSKLIHNSAGARLATREKLSRLVELWNQMPPKVRTDLRYPHLKTMLATDPTEAVLFEQHNDDEEMIQPVTSRQGSWHVAQLS